MRRLSKVTAFAIALALAAPAFAQDAKGGALRPVADDPAPAPAPAPAESLPPPAAPAPADAPAPAADPGAWRGQPAAPAPAAPAPAAPANGADPLAQPQAPAAPAPAKDPNEIGPDDPRAAKIIEKNLTDAENTYTGVLAEDGAVDNLDHRIASNEKMAADYKSKLAGISNERRKIQVELYNRTFYLKQQRDRGAIPEDVFNRLVKQEEKKFSEKSSRLKSDVDFYEKEIADAEKRLVDLRAERKLKVGLVSPKKKGAVGKNGKAAPKTGSSLVMSLKDRLEKLSAFRTRNTMDGPVCEACLRQRGHAGPHTGEPPPPAEAAAVEPPPGGG
jgi:hypothetical protein